MTRRNTYAPVAAEHRGGARMVGHDAGILNRRSAQRAQHPPQADMEVHVQRNAAVLRAKHFGNRRLLDVSGDQQSSERLTRASRWVSWR